MDGFADPAFSRVADVFRDLLESGQETGGALAAYVGGRLVVDLWGGWADAARTHLWARDTLVTTFSTGKPLAALTVLRHVATGAIELDAPVARYWPEFATAGKDAATVRHALSHAAGVPAIAAPLPTEAAYDWDRFCTAIAETPAAWEPGTAFGEHALTYGHLVGNVLRRASGTTVKDVLRDEIGHDVHFGLDLADLERVAEVEYAVDDWPAQAIDGHGDLWARALGNPPGLLTREVLNGSGWRRSEIPAVNAHCTARGLAAVYQALATRELLPEALLTEALAPQVDGVDLLLQQQATWTLGWRRDGSWVGMGGIGGSSAGLDEEKGYTLAYVTRRLGTHDRGEACYDALEACL
jgi:CubicO group peptidase (beta-lactamase class C family)